MNIAKFEIKSHLKTTMIWTIAVSLIGMMYIAMEPAFLDQSEALISLLNGMGDAFLDGLGINVDTFFTPVGFFAYVGGFMALALCVQATIYGIRTFTLEKNTNSIEFLYTKPTSRIKIFVSKYFANVVLLIITQVIVITVLYLFTDVVNSADYDHMLMFLMLFTFVPLQFMFYALGTVIGTSVNRLKSVVPVAIMIPMVMFFLNMLSGIVDNDVVSYLSFFNYYNLSDIVFNEGYDNVFVLISVGIIIGLTAISLVMIKRRDLKVL